MKAGKFILAFCSATMILATGCSGSECYDNHSAMPLAAFYSAQNGAAVNVGPVTIQGVGAPNDSVLYFEETLNQAYLPFRLAEDETTYIFEYAAAIPADTIKFKYRPKPWFVSPACGAMYFFDMEETQYTTFAIDSIATEPTITNVNTANIKIYFKGDIDANMP